MVTIFLTQAIKSLKIGSIKNNPKNEIDRNRPNNRQVVIFDYRGLFEVLLHNT
jgi:hypothetical protein